MTQQQTSRTENSRVTPDTVTDVYGLEVYSQTGVYLGVVEDVRLDFRQNSATGLALVDTNRELQSETNNQKEGVVIPYNWVESVHDIVITIDVINRLRSD